MVRRSSRWLALTAALIVVAWQSLVPGGEALVQTAFDKVGHALVYAVLGALAAFALTRPRLLPAWLGIIAFGLATEIAQSLTGYRSFEVADLLADALGSLLGAGVVVVIVRRRARNAA